MKLSLFASILLILSLTGCGAESPAAISGPQGPQGVSGSSGPQGVQGVPGTSISVIQFCSGYAPTYPTVFPEVGLCIDGELYAEYYAPPSSGLVLLPPGLYSTTQTGAPCTFTVAADCQVVDE